MSSTRVTSADRFGVTLLFSLIMHGVLALGISFDFPLPRPALPALDVTLVQTANQERPDAADFLAQADNTGGGTEEEALRPAERVSGELPIPQAGEAPRAVTPAAPAAQDARRADVVTTTAATAARSPDEPEQRARPERDQRRAEEEISRRMEMARLAAEVSEQQQRYAKRPKVKYLSANTREYAYAAYMRAWVARVQRIGNLNYPEQARARGLHGDLILTVVLRADGSVKAVEVIRGSGQAVLDDAAVRIVHLSAPFPAVPATAGEFDEFNITRTWQFQRDGNLRTRG